jgi:hypothetical protein
MRSLLCEESRRAVITDKVTKAKRRHQNSSGYPYQHLTHSWRQLFTLKSLPGIVPSLIWPNLLSDAVMLNDACVVAILVRRLKLDATHGSFISDEYEVIGIGCLL